MQIAVPARTCQNNLWTRLATPAPDELSCVRLPLRSWTCHGPVMGWQATAGWRLHPAGWRTRRLSVSLIGFPGWTRTITSRAKICCATVTLRGIESQNLSGTKRLTVRYSWFMCITRLTMHSCPSRIWIGGAGSCHRHVMRGDLRFPLCATESHAPT